MDIRTLSLLLGIACILEVIAIYFQYRINKTYRGIGWWVSGFFLLGTSFLLLILRDFVPIALISIILANTLNVLGLFFIYIGSMRFLGKNENREILIIIFIAFLLPFFYYTYISNDIAARTVFVSVVVAVVTFLIAQAFLSNQIRSIKVSANYIAGLLIAYGCFFIIRVVVTLSTTSIYNFFTPTLLQTTLFLVSFIEGILLTFGLIIMVNQRLTADMRENKDNFELIFSTNPDSVHIFRLHDGTIVNLNERFTDLTGYTRSESIGKSSLEINLWKNPADRQKMVQELHQKGNCESIEAIFQRKDGSLFTGIMSARTIYLQNILHIISVTHDITERKLAEDAMRGSQEKFSNIVEKQTDMICRWAPDTTLSYINPAYCTYFGVSRDNLVGHKFIDFLPVETQNVVRRAIERLMAQEVDSITELEKNISPQGEERWVIWVYSPIHNQLNQCIEIQSVGRDITERKRLEDELQRQAFSDSLTGISNRRHFLELAQSELKRAIRLAHPFSLVLIDLDHFKYINDTYGHAGGDQVLVAFTKSYLKYTREIDLLARVGGDEFALLLPETSPEQAFAAAERLRESLISLPIVIGGDLVSISSSSGVSSLTGDHESLDTLLSKADKALYRAKETGRNRVAIE